MPNSRTFARLAGGLVAAGLVVFSSFAYVENADAARRRRRGKNLGVQRINVDNSSGIPGNFVIEVAFTAPLDASTVTPATFQIREQNATQTGFTKQVFGDFQIAGRLVRWYPRLPGHLRDPADPAGGFYREGTPRDDASENAGLRPAKKYEIALLGRDTFSPLRSSRRRPLRRTRRATFTTADATVLKELYTTTTYVDAPPPQFSFSNPIDRIPSANDQYAVRGGSKDVPNDLGISLFCTRVPLSPGTARVLGNVVLTILERKGDKSVRRPVVGSIFVEQNFSTTLLVFEPRFALSDLGVYALRVNKNVKDLTEEYDFAANRDRERLRGIYDWLSAARAAEILSGNSNPDPTTLADPPAQLISDWPADGASRGVLKANMLDLGDLDPDEIDPRVMVLFSTRDEPVSEDIAVVDFDRSDGLFDGTLSTGEWDAPGGIISAASAIRTIAGGSAADGDFLPTVSGTLNMNAFPGNEVNFRDVVIPQGVTVTLSGSGPARFNAIGFTLNGTLRADGSAGNPGGRGGGNFSRPLGGAGGPGGGAGGDAAEDFNATPFNNVGGKGGPGLPGTDFDGVEAGPGEGGQGGQGGDSVGTGTSYRMGSGGGGGGAREDGSVGQTASWPTSANWSNGNPGPGGLGAGDNNLELDPLVGGAGGGAGANHARSATATTQQWFAGSGGGGGGAVRVQTARVLNIGSTGVIQARGGDGARGNNATTSQQSGGGGAGGGGSLLLRSGSGFNIADAGNAFDVSGGNRSTLPNSQGRANGGDGGAGYIRLEDATGGIDVPGGTSGVFDPIGGGVPSYVYSRFLDLGVQGRILEFENEDIDTVTDNDAIYVEIQMTREDTTVFGAPDLSAIDDAINPDIFAAQGTLNPAITSPWLPLKLHDDTGGRAFPNVAYDPTAVGNPNEATFPVADALNGNDYRFIRYRIFFQLDDAHAGGTPIPFVGSIVAHFQFNF